ncbi:MAG: tRNA 2-selenouridine(34) synthase MnmH [Bacteroidetes bacterium]|nr:tRNA 2-selenouridine(34) synthase MnmH [Bacteroidota bacterium]
MAIRIEAEQFLSQSDIMTVVDVRSPAEYLQGHIPGAMNIPLFDDRERAVVGTIYKNSGREASILKGLELAGPKLSMMVKKLNTVADQKAVLVHCWRGGMRSESMAWLFEQAGYSVSVLDGGYKAYRKFIRDRFSQPLKIVVLGGLTGSGKTEILEALAEKGEQVLDLERLAFHKGSVFGGLGQPDQPTNEQFENDIYAEWEKYDPGKITWIEDESRMIGKLCIPDPLFDQMNRSPMIMIETNREERIRRLVSEYSDFEKEELEGAILKISEKLGGANTKTALSAITSGDFDTAAGLMLVYYDKSYTHSVDKRLNKDIFTIMMENDTGKNVTAVLNQARRLFP